ncbi:TPA: HAD hydrolase-like protein [Candidatus Woesearchaeota archaeon]|nr:HAD hydrolase-like protein [Candidatus Woesearchaeota archaeon]
MIKAIIFDLGRVIVDVNDTDAVKALIRYTKKDQASVHFALFYSKHYENFTLGRILPAEFYAAVKKDLKLTCSFAKFKFIWNNIFKHRPKVEQLIRKLKQKKDKLKVNSNHYSLILLSDTNKLHFEFILKNYPILKEFNDVVVSYKHNCKKPSKKIFLIALKKAKSLAGAGPDECLYLDDLIENIEDARQLGITAMQYTKFHDLVAAFKRFGINRGI